MISEDLMRNKYQVRDTSFSIFGLGYVGIINAIYFAEKGYKVIGIDIDHNKVTLINQGRSPIKERGVNEKLRAVIKEGRLVITTDVSKAMNQSDISYICVGTPSKTDGSVDLTSVIDCMTQISLALKAKQNYHIIVIRSTIPPGTTETNLCPLVEKVSGKKLIRDFDICIFPEFLREGHALEDVYNQDVLVIGSFSTETGRLILKVHENEKSKIIITDARTAEMVKYAFNVFHALKISFINELANICEILGLDPNIVSEALCSDCRLNISPYYLKPGYAFGGPCLPKDLSALIKLSEERSYTPYLLKSVVIVNEYQKRKAIACIKRILGENLSGKNITVIGIAFKKGTNDLRNSPAVYLVEKLLEYRAKIKIYDPYALEDARRYFANRLEYSDNVKKAVEDTDICVIALKYVNAEELKGLANYMRRKNILDLVGINGYEFLSKIPGINYIGISW